MRVEPEGKIVLTEEDLGDKLFETIASQIKILTDSKYECLVYYEDCGIYVIEFAYHDFDMGCPSHKMIAPEEYEDLLYQRTGQNTEDKDGE